MSEKYSKPRATTIYNQQSYLNPSKSKKHYNSTETKHEFNVSDGFINIKDYDRVQDYSRKREEGRKSPKVTYEELTSILKTDL